MTTRSLLCSILLLTFRIGYAAPEHADCLVNIQVVRDIPLASADWKESVHVFDDLADPPKEVALNGMQVRVPTPDGLFAKLRIQVVEEPTGSGKPVSMESLFVIDEPCETTYKMYVGVVSPIGGTAADIQRIRDDPDVESPPSPVRAAFEMARTMAAAEGRRIHRGESGTSDQWDLLACFYALKTFRFFRDEVGKNTWPLMSGTLTNTASWHRQLINRLDQTYPWARDKSLSNERMQAFDYYRSRWDMIANVNDKAKRFDRMVRFKKSLSNDDRATRDEILKAIGLSPTEPENSISAIAAQIPPAVARDAETRAQIEEHIEHIQTLASASPNAAMKARVAGDVGVLQRLIH